MSSVFRFLLVGLLSSIGPGAFASPSEICDRAATRAARDFNIPSNVLRAITRVETGQRRNGELRPWPWTVNMEGEGHWFPDQDAARAYVFRNFKQGKRSFDVGCFQINYRWHNEGFSSIDEMFDPDANAKYAARFLLSLYDEFGGWEAAVGAYHSRTKEKASRYLSKYRTVAASLTAASAPQFGFGLFPAGGQPQANGSLMPAQLSPRPPLLRTKSQ